MINKKLKIIENKKLNETQFKLVLRNDSSWNIKPGNFFMLGISHGNHILKRPIAVFDYDQGDVSLIYNVVGEGTKILSKISKGNEISVIGPVGNSFPRLKNKKVILVAGGTGIFPMNLAAKELIANNKVILMIGVRNKESFPTYNLFKKINCKLIITSDDGSIGIKGNPILILKKTINEFCPDVIYTCGPEILMKKVYEIASEDNIKVYGSYEKKMGCGYGACMGCSIKTTIGMKKVCNDGPVFDMDEVILDEQ